MNNNTRIVLNSEFKSDIRGPNFLETELSNIESYRLSYKIFYSQPNFTTY